MPVGIGHSIHIIEAAGLDLVGNDGEFLSVEQVNLVGKPLHALLAGEIENRLLLTGFSALGGDHDDPVSPPRTVYGRRGSILQDLHGQNVGRVQERDVIEDHTVDDIDRGRVVERSNSPDPDRRVGARCARSIGDLHAGDPPLETLDRVGRRNLCDIVGLDARHRTRQVAFPDGTIADHHDLLQGDLRGLELDIHNVQVGGIDLLGHIANVRDHQDYCS